jgi:iron complex transport system ATP-binding protein
VIGTVEIAGLTVRRAGASVVHGLDLSVAEGEWVGLIGPNGAGKSSVLEAISGVLDSSGVVEIGGRQMSSLGPVERAKRVALVPQSPVIPPGMTVIDYVMLGRTPYLGRFGAESTADVLAANIAIADLELGPLASRPVEALSGGERQRVVIARALAQACPVLLLDEPTSALDVGVRMDVLDHIDAIRRSCGLTVISAVHDLTLAAQFCDRLVMLAGGAIVAQGSAEGVLTVDTIRRHYGARVRVISDADGVIVIPIRSDDSREVGRSGRMTAPR